MMILIDTSIWIRAFAQRQPFAAEAAKLIREGKAVAHELVYGELLMGDIGGRGQFLRDYERMPQAKPVPHLDVVVLVRGRHLQGRGVGWIDVQLLASALARRMRLWTADPRLATMAEELGVDYRLAGA
jgi:predicted nucleic acid-binding protein